ncbi:MAG: hypothetical protein PHU43_11400 [Candidatus Bipolaricaulis sp.]|nr:hypothetical protein [Candidatus Bipolaricaulis sp.]
MIGVWAVGSVVYLVVTAARPLRLLGGATGELVECALLALWFVIGLGQFRVFLSVARGRPCGFGMVFQGFERFGPAMGLQLLLMLRYFAVMLPPLVVVFVTAGPLPGAGPGLRAGLYIVWALAGLLSIALVIRLALRYAFAGVLLLDESLGSFDSLQRSAEITQGSLLRLLGMGLILFFPAVPAAAALVFSQLYLSPIPCWAVTSASAFAIGAVVGPWAIASQVAAYRALRGEGRGAAAGSGEES